MLRAVLLNTFCWIMTKVAVKYKQKNKHANAYQTWFFLALLKREVTPDNIVESVDFSQVLYGK